MEVLVTTHDMQDIGINRTARNFILKSVLTMNNFKVVLSFGYWFASYMIMGIFGGSVAYLHFQRKDMDVPDPLPDFGYEAIPVSFFISRYYPICLINMQNS